MRWSEDIVGIDFADNGLVATRVAAGNPGPLRLLNAGWVQVDPAASDRDWAAALRQLWRTAGLKTRTVCASLRSRSALLRYFRYPALDPVELASALGLEAEDSLQLPREEIALDWHLSRPLPLSGTKVRSDVEGLLVAVPRKHLEQQLHILRLAGLFPVAVDAAPAALANLHAAVAPDAGERAAVCLLQLAAHRADIAVVFGEQGLYARTLYPRGDSWEASLGPLMEGVQDALKYYVFKLGGQTVRRLLVGGTLPAQADFLAGLQQKAGVPVEKWDPAARLVPGSAHVRRLLAEAGRPPLETSLGLALRRFDDE